MKYRRANVKGGTYFFTVNLAERRRSLLVDQIETLRTVFKSIKTKHPFYIDAMVVLPDHLHALWSLPEEDNDYPMRWMLIKSGFSRRILKGEQINASKQRKGERGIWQRRYWEHCIRDDRDYEQHINYIHYNPVKHNYVHRAVDWPYSSVHRYIRDGLLPRSWGASEGFNDTQCFGEKY
jgi:putative transposase